MDPRFELQLGEHTLSFDRDRDFLQPTEIGLAFAQHLELPALQCGIALVHLEQVATEQGCLLAAGSSPDFQDGAALIRGVLRQQCQPKRQFRGRQPFARLWQIGRRKFPHLGILQKRVQPLHLIPSRPVCSDGVNHRTQFRKLA